jgi:hypothetical protein
MCARIRWIPRRTSASSIDRPFIWIRSLNRTKCGEVNSPVLTPAAREMESIIAQTEPLPLVPATWTNRNSFCGFPRFANKRRTLSRPSLTPRFWVANNQSIATL